jgi:hypothetical protein
MKTITMIIAIITMNGFNNLFAVEERQLIGVKQYGEKIMITLFYRTIKNENIKEKTLPSYVIIKGNRYELNFHDGFRFGSQTGMESNIDELWVDGLKFNVKTIERIYIQQVTNGQKWVIDKTNIEIFAQQGDAPEPVSYLTQ